MRGQRRQTRVLRTLVFGCVFGTTHCDEPPQVEAVASAAPSSSAPAFSQAAVDAVVAAGRGALMKVCAADLAQANERQLSLFFEIDAQGAVTDATAAGGSAAERPLRKCVEKQLGGWKFPAPGEARTVSAMVTLSD